MQETTNTNRRLAYFFLVAVLTTVGLLLGVRSSAGSNAVNNVHCSGAYCVALPVVRNNSPYYPTAPNLTVTEVTPNATYILDWSDGAEEEALYWELQGSSNPSFATRELIQVNATGITINFSSGIRYYRVRGVGTGGFGAWSNVVSINASSFTANKTVVNRSADECATLSWNYTNIKAFQVSLGKGYDLQAANGVGSATVCPSIKTTYVARVTNQDDSVDTYEVTIDVSGEGCNLDPYFVKFETTNANPNPNESFTISWDVQCTSVAFYKVGNFTERPVTGSESHEESTPEDRTYQLRLEVRSGTTVIKEAKASILIDVK